jgi:hypothetical protein
VCKPGTRRIKDDGVGAVAVNNNAECGDLQAAAEDADLHRRQARKSPPAWFWLLAGREVGGGGEIGLGLEAGDTVLQDADGGQQRL